MNQENHEKKSAQRDTNTVRQKFSPRRPPPSRGRRTAKIKSAGDGHYLHLHTQFGEDRCMQFRVIVVTDTARHKHTHRQDRLQCTAPLASAQCNKHSSACRLCGDDPIAMIRLLQRSLSSQSLGTQLNQTRYRHY